MIIWGWQTRSIDLGQQQIQYCGHCRQQRPFRLAFQYTFFRLYCLFGMVTSKRYIRQCSCCGKGWRQEPCRIDPDRRPSIPFMHRFGLFMFIAFFAALVVLKLP